MQQGVKTLLAGLIDYAGLFPPASLSMAEATEEFNRQRLGTEEFALGRFICPASRLDELSEAAQALMPGTYATSGYREMAQPGMSEPWGISATIDTELGEAVARIDAFNERHEVEDHGKAVVDSVELTASSADEIDAALDGIPAKLRPYFEISLEADARGLIAALAGQDGVGAKVRCGGVTPEAIPEIEPLAAFITAAAPARVPFKATAGLHHPIRGEHALTYEPDAPRAVMHGFVNVFLAAAMAMAGKADEKTVQVILRETDADAFRVTSTEASWRDVSITIGELADARQRFSVCYGSCSFREPIEDLRALSWL